MSLDTILSPSSDSISTVLRQAVYGLATTCILGTAVYVGYRVATPRKSLSRQYRHPELNDQVISYTIDRELSWMID